MKKNSKQIYVGNLSVFTSKAQVRALFEQHGKVESIAWITDQETGRVSRIRFRGNRRVGANTAIKSLNSQLVGSRELNADEARPKSNRNRTGGYNSYY